MSAAFEMKHNWNAWANCWFTETRAKQYQTASSMNADKFVSIGLKHGKQCRCCYTIHNARFIFWWYFWQVFFCMVFVNKFLYVVHILKIYIFSEWVWIRCVYYIILKFRVIPRSKLLRNRQIILTCVSYFLEWLTTNIQSFIIIWNIKLFSLIIIIHHY